MQAVRRGVARHPCPPHVPAPATLEPPHASPPCARASRLPPAQGQSVVPPAEAQVIFSTVPLWSIAFAYLLLGGEPMSEKTLVGGAAVVAAGIIASRKDGAEEGGKPPGEGGKEA